MESNCKTCKDKTTFDVLDDKTTEKGRLWRKMKCQKCNKMKCTFYKNDTEASKEQSPKSNDNVTHCDENKEPVNVEHCVKKGKVKHCKKKINE